MQKRINHLSLIMLAAVSLTACTQTTPSMMNTSKVELARQTSLEQIPLADVNETTMAVLANDYNQYGSGSMDIVMTYDPKAKDFTAMNAVHTLKDAQTSLRKQGVKNIHAQTLAVPEGKPSLIVSYDTVTAQAPSDCTPMPGMDNNETGRFIGDYKFGCGVETAFAKQIARPADLEGNSDMGVRSGRRDATIIEGYSAGIPREPLDGIERDDLASGN